MKKVIGILVSLWAVTGVGVAQETPGWEVSGGYQYTRLDLVSLPDQAKVLNATVEAQPGDIGSRANASGFNFGVQENANSWFSGLFTFSGSYPHINSDITNQLLGSGLPPAKPQPSYNFKANGQLYNFMFGPQFTLRSSPTVQPFVRLLIGLARENFDENVSQGGAPLLGKDMRVNDSGLAIGAGVGMDIRMTNQVYMRLAGDYERTPVFNNTQNNFMVSADITYRIGSK